ncbi:hypothetical protein Tam1G_1488 [Bifidobacterium imperatoris]|uniref:Uncharacterized protein n=1 Tax=Bifidobacterium imperatoris TaxID=2020965 RepID=A0A2N5IR55_9BIFI|nr:hypothetical protein Tam1G_1488 [Bifidobacterium imperatoris]
MAIVMAPRWHEAAGKLIADGAGSVAANAKQLGTDVVAVSNKAGKAIASGAKQIGQEAKLLRNTMVHAEGESAQGEQTSTEPGLTQPEVSTQQGDMSKKLGDLFRR